MTNSEQLAELESLEAIYEGSREVLLEIPDPVEPRPAGRVGFSLEATLRALHLTVRIRLPPDYLADEASLAAPTFELTSDLFSAKRLAACGQELDALAQTLGGAPVLCSALEWLRLEAAAVLRPPPAQGYPVQEELEAAEADEFFNDIPSPDAVELARPANCENCLAALTSDNTVFLSTCNHFLCSTCACSITQIYAANGHANKCPLPDCRAPAGELPELVALELWVSVSKRVMATKFKDCFVFCPFCEDRGMDIPVVTCITGAVEEALHTCKCFQCNSIFCAICRSPPHRGSCFDDERHVVRMAKRRPPLTPELAEMAAKRAEEVWEQERLRAEALRSTFQTAVDFESFRRRFWQAYEQQIMAGLWPVFGSEMDLRPTPLKLPVQNRFLLKGESLPDVELRPAFHGTDPANYASIFSRGLLIPGKDNELRVVNGSAHGLGIYTANVDAAFLSRNFCKQPSMLICAVRQKDVSYVGDAMVVFHADNVIPLFEAVAKRFMDTAPAPSMRIAPNTAQSVPNNVLTKVPKISPGKPTVASAAPSAKQSAPATKKSKFLQRLAAKSQKH